MTLRGLYVSVLACALPLVCIGCKEAPGRPDAIASRPGQVVQVNVLYKNNCAACHGRDGKNGAAISLANPVYLTFAGANTIQKVAANGVPGTLMPAFAKSQGGMLTDQQIEILAQGVESKWGKGNALVGQTAPPYVSGSAGDVAQGQKAFATFCAGCHGVDGTGVSGGKLHTGSLVDPAYLALISDQGLRSLIVAGQPDEGMPDWRSDITGPGSRAMTDQEITDVVAWLASHRIAAPGQPYVHP